MQLELLELLFLSEKREQLLLYLKDGPKNIDEIKEALQANATTILPQIKKLKEKSLVIQQDKTYMLSIVGEILVEKMQPLINVINVFEDNFEYWTEKDLHGIPPGFRKRIGELGKCKLIQPNLDRMFEIDQEIVENLFRSKFVFECVSYFHSPLISLCRELAKRGVEFKILTSESVFERYFENCSEELQSMLALENIKFFLYPGEIRIANLTVTDKFFLISLFSKKQKYYDRENLISYEPSALKFGTELFDELLRDSTLITQKMS